MRLVTRFELAKKTDEELHALLRQIFNAVSAATDEHQRSVAIASIQNIQNELMARTLT